MNALRVLILALGVLIIGGCATTSTAKKEAWEAQLNSWLGRSVEDLVKSVGYPARTLTAPNGNTVYVFEYARSGSVPHTSYTVGKHGLITWGPTTYSSYENHCTTFFEVDAEQKVVAWRYEGNVYRLPRTEASK